MSPKIGHGHSISGVLDVISKLKIFWKEWNVPALVITSLTLQLILILVGPFRKKTCNGVVIVTVWLAYLIADWVAAQAVGLISRERTDLYAFWAQFLLLHLGGPDTITALAVEDNNLWLRTGLHLAVQGYTTLGVLVRSIQTSKLWVPTVLMFIAGNIKYMERVSALFCGRLTKFDEDPYHYVDELATHEPHIVFVGPPAEEETEIEMVRSAFYFFNYYKGLYADRQIKFAMRLRSKRYFDWIRKPEDTFKVLELQFYFAYEAIYTKMRITEMKSWKILRPIVMLIAVGCLVIWCFSNKHGIKGQAILITYSLLIGAIIVDILGFLRILFSYRNIAYYSQGSPIRAWAYDKMLLLYNRNWGRYWRKDDAPIWPWLRRTFFRRWSESVLQLNLVDMIMEKEKTRWWEKLADFFDFKDDLYAFTNQTKKWFANDLRDFIVEDLKCKSLWVDIDERKASYICYSKGSYACLSPSISAINAEKLGKLRGLLDVSKEYESILLHWHIITELFYCAEVQISENGAHKSTLFRRLITKFEWSNSEQADPKGKTKGMEEYREMSKTLSDYAMYLLLQQPVTMSAVVTGNTKQMISGAREQIEELLKAEYSSYFGDHSGTSTLSKEAQKREACQRFRNIIGKGKVDSTPPPPDPPILSWADFPYSIHPILGGLEDMEDSKWKFMAEVWAELVYYAAIRCRPSVHAAQLKQGGELLSFVWLLMFQLGFGLHGSEHEALQLQQQLLAAASATTVDDPKEQQHQSPKNSVTPSTEQQPSTDQI